MSTTLRLRTFFLSRKDSLELSGKYKYRGRSACSGLAVFAGSKLNNKNILSALISPALYSFEVTDRHYRQATAKVRVEWPPDVQGTESLSDVPSYFAW